MPIDTNISNPEDIDLSDIEQSDNINDCLIDPDLRGNVPQDTDDCMEDDDCDIEPCDSESWGYTESNGYIDASGATPIHRLTGTSGTTLRFSQGSGDFISTNDDCTVTVGGTDITINTNQHDHVDSFESIEVPDYAEEYYNRILEYDGPERATMRREVMNALGRGHEFRNEIISYLEYVIETIDRGLISNASSQAKLNPFRNRPDGRSKLHSPMGFEFTYHYPKKSLMNNVTKGGSQSDFRNHMNNVLNDYIKDGAAKIYHDGGQIEICSPVFKTWKAAIEWFTHVDKTFKLHGCRPYLKKKGGGGMHFNISYNKNPKNWRLLYYNFYMFMANHPEICWIFNEPSDNHTAKCLAQDHSFMNVFKKSKLLRHAMNNDWKFEDKNDIWSKFVICGGKSTAINSKGHEYFEVRTFEMPRSLDEFKDMLEFTNNLLKLSQTFSDDSQFLPFRNNMFIPDDGNMCYVRKEATGVKDFNHLLNCMGMDHNRYNKYVNRNFNTRINIPYGRKYLT